MIAADIESLLRPLSPWSPKAWYYATARAFLGSLGRLSCGIRIGQEHGFDSGVMLDYVYENRAAGAGPLGRLIDRAYLDSPGWRGIRNRGQLVEAALLRAIAEALADGGPVRIADLACGGGRYVLDALAGLAGARPVAATLRDYRPENVAKARANAAARRLKVTVERADAFSDADLARLGPVDVAIVSGLHEIVDDDIRIANHFRQVGRIPAPGGSIMLVTVQPHHPQVEFIARVLKSHSGKPWAMRLRPLKLTRQWLGEAGFAVEKLAMEPLGIFGVICARKG